MHLLKHIPALRKVIFFILLVIPVFSFSQSTSKQITVFNGKVKLLIPNTFKNMSTGAWETRHHNKNKSEIALLDENESFELTAENTHEKLNENLLGIIKRDFIKVIKDGKAPEITEIVDTSIKVVNSKKILILKFRTQISTVKVFNCHLYVVVDNEVIFFTITYPENADSKLSSKFEKIMEDIIASVIVS